MCICLLGQDTLVCLYIHALIINPVVTRSVCCPKSIMHANKAVEQSVRVESAALMSVSYHCLITEPVLFSALLCTRSFVTVLSY